MCARFAARIGQHMGSTIRAAADENLSLRLDVSRLWPQGQRGLESGRKKSEYLNNSLYKIQFGSATCHTRTLNLRIIFVCLSKMVKIRTFGSIFFLFPLYFIVVFCEFLLPKPVLHHQHIRHCCTRHPKPDFRSKRLEFMADLC